MMHRTPADSGGVNPAGYSKEQAARAVGPGWTALAAAAWRAVAEADGVIRQVKEKWGALTIYHSAGYDTPAGRRVTDLEAQSRTICEACGSSGRLWPENDAEAATIRERTGRHRLWRKTFCTSCGYRYYYEGARGWDAITALWSADDEGD
jgi:hypothetical protein